MSISSYTSPVLSTDITDIVQLTSTILSTSFLIGSKVILNKQLLPVSPENRPASPILSFK